MRVGAANCGRCVEHHGGVQVDMPANEMYEAMAQGAVDCAVLSVAELSGRQMADVVDYAMVDVPGGVYSGVDPQNFNLATWSGLTDPSAR